MASGSRVPQAEPLASAAEPTADPRVPVLSAEQLQAQLDRNAETGKAGELGAVSYELQRLAAAGCPFPQDFVRRVALTDVGRGYDIESTWPGEERRIEVKSTTRLGSDICLSKSEREVLRDLGDKAWLYRVLVTPDGAHVVGEPLRNPIEVLEKTGMTAVVWRVADPSTDIAERVS